MNRGWGADVRTVQPGGGPVAALALAWGRLRRAWLRAGRPRYVRELEALRTRQCPGCTHDVVDGRDLLWVQNVCAVRLPAARTVSPFRDRFGLVRLGRADVLACCVAGATVGLLGAWLTPWLAVLGLLPPAFALRFFRDPERDVPGAPELVLAPADGVLDDVRREEQCPFFAGAAWRLGIYLSVWDVHVNRAPVHGIAERFDYRPGRRVPTVRRGVTDANEQLVTWFHADAGLPVVVRQIAGPLARRICNVLGAGDRVAAGERFGLIKFGSRTELWLPADARLELAARRGQRVVGGVSVLARFVPT
jgi:phosphatidylserine decarboxylase